MNFLRKMLGGTTNQATETDPAPVGPASPEPENRDTAPGDASLLATLFQENASLEATLPVLLKATEAVANLHRAGRVHGHLKPEAISINPLLDDSQPTLQGEKWQEPFASGEYAAPELAREGTVAHPTADVYSLGVLFYQALAGQPVETILGDEAVQRRVFAISGVPQILGKALGTPEQRFQNAGEFYDALSRWTSRHLPMPEYIVATASTIGLNPIRTANEDAVLQLSGGWQGEDGQARWALLAVADGMGGMDAGEAAAQAAVRSLAQSAMPLATLDRVPEEEVQAQWNKQWANQAATAVTQAMQAQNAHGGCTLITALAIGNRITLAHAGDCRAYVFSALTGAWKVLTRDHSYVATLWQAGEIAWEELRTHPNRNQITRALGDKAQVPEWFFDTLEIETGQLSLTLAPGEVLLLGSDGAWEPMVEEEMAQIIREHFPNLGTAANAMLELALERGAPDNATVALLALTPTDSANPTASQEQ